MISSNSLKKSIKILVIISLICMIFEKTEKSRPSGRHITLTLQTGFEPVYPFGLVVFRTTAPPSERLQHI